MKQVPRLPIIIILSLECWNFKIYIFLRPVFLNIFYRKEERLAVIQFHAAVRIQAFWRGCLIRNNWKIVEAATIKIQVIRIFFANEKYKLKI